MYASFLRTNEWKEPLVASRWGFKQKKTCSLPYFHQLPARPRLTRMWRPKPSGRERASCCSATSTACAESSSIRRNQSLSARLESMATLTSPGARGGRFNAAAASGCGDGGGAAGDVGGVQCPQLYTIILCMQSKHTRDSIQTYWLHAIGQGSGQPARKGEAAPLPAGMGGRAVWHLLGQRLLARIVQPAGTRSDRQCSASCAGGAAGRQGHCEPAGCAAGRHRLGCLNILPD